MKKIIYLLPFSMLLTYCSTSKMTTTPGVSNVKVNDAPAAATINTAVETRDWGYKSTRDTALSGEWQLEGMLAANGNWKPVDSWYPTDSAAVDSTALPMDSSTAMTDVNEAFNPNPPMASTNKNFGSKMRDTSYHYFDTAAFRQQLTDRDKPFDYWKRIPKMTIMPSLGIFSGNTGCNSMSGGFNFTETLIKFENNIRTSKMLCNEYDEVAFLANLVKVDNYIINANVLELKQADTVLLTFKRN